MLPTNSTYKCAELFISLSLSGGDEKKIRELKSELKTFTSKFYCIILVVKLISMYAHARYTFCTK